MTKKRIIIGILILLLLMAGIGVNIIAFMQKEEIESKPELSTNIEDKVEKAPSKKVPSKNTVVENILTEEDLELTGDRYNSVDVQDEEGNKISLTTEENKPMVILYWNDSDELSIEALKILQNFYKKYDKKITFSLIAVLENIDENKESIINILQENEITIPIVYDNINGDAVKSNNINKIPSLVMINKKGEVINIVTDEINEDIVEANLDIVAENF